MVLIGIDPYPGNYSFRLAFQHAYFDGFGTHGHRRFYGGTGPVVIDPSPRFETFKMIWTYLWSAKTLQAGQPRI